MKKLMIIFCFIGVALACTNSNAGKTGSADNAAEAVKDPEVEKGLQLVANSDCLTCHKIAEPLTGPAYKAIANKYPDNSETVSLLSAKIINGGSGNWGPVMMLPHPQISKQDAESMVKYILSLKDPQ